MMKIILSRNCALGGYYRISHDLETDPLFDTKQSCTPNFTANYAILLMTYCPRVQLHDAVTTERMMKGYHLRTAYQCCKMVHVRFPYSIGLRPHYHWMHLLLVQLFWYYVGEIYALYRPGNSKRIFRSDPHSTCSYTMCTLLHWATYIHYAHSMQCAACKCTKSISIHVIHTCHGICIQTYIQSYVSCPYHTLCCAVSTDHACTCASASMVCTSFGKEGY